MSNSTREKALYWWTHLPKQWKEDYAKHYKISVKFITESQIIKIYKNNDG